MVYGAEPFPIRGLFDTLGWSNECYEAVADDPAEELIDHGKDRDWSVVTDFFRVALL